MASTHLSGFAGQAGARGGLPRLTPGIVPPNPASMEVGYPATVHYPRSVRRDIPSHLHSYLHSFRPFTRYGSIPRLRAGNWNVLAAQLRYSQ
jgi:hypothetical protein